MGCSTRASPPPPLPLRPLPNSNSSNNRKPIVAGVMQNLSQTPLSRSHWQDIWTVIAPQHSQDWATRTDSRLKSPLASRQRAHRFYRLHYLPSSRPWSHRWSVSSRTRRLRFPTWHRSLMPPILGPVPLLPRPRPRQQERHHRRQVTQR